MQGDGRVVLVTGSSRGIGRETAARLGDLGYRVAVHYVTSAGPAEELVAALREGGGEAEAFRADVSDPDACQALVKAVAERFGGLDALVNNAGIIDPAPFDEMSPQSWDAVMGVNLRGTFLCAWHAFRQMKRQRSGTIVNVSSLSGIRGTEKFPGFAAYTASKHGVVGLTEALAVEARPLGIRVACVAPGAVDTAMLRKAAPGLKAGAKPDDIAAILTYFVVEESSVPLNGSVLEVHSNG